MFINIPYMEHLGRGEITPVTNSFSAMYRGPKTPITTIVWATLVRFNTILCQPESLPPKKYEKDFSRFPH